MSEATTNVAAALAAAQARKAPRTIKPQASKAAVPVRTPITYESAERLCPSEGVINRVVVAFGLDAVNTDAVREATEEAVACMAKALSPYMNEKALEMHLQRVVGAHVGSAHGAGSFYDSRAEAARNLSSALRNETRDEDRPGIDGTDNRAARAREFAAIAAVQAYAALAAARGAVDAYAEITGQEWKPYAGNAQPGQRVDQRAAAAQVAAFDKE